MSRGGGKYVYTVETTLNSPWNPIYFTEHSCIFDEEHIYVKIGVPLSLPNNLEILTLQA